MRKIFTTRKYKAKYKRRLKKLERRKHGKNNLVNKKRLKRKNKGQSFNNRVTPRKPKVKGYSIKPTILAPKNLNLFEYPEDCLDFFNKLRSSQYVTKLRSGKKYIDMSIINVENIDYASISILLTITADLISKGINVRGNLPADPECKKFMIDSGYLNNLYNEKGIPYPKSEKSHLYSFKKGGEILSVDDNIIISNTVKKVVKHLTGKDEQCLSVKSILLEICGNTLEWGGSESKHWHLGVKYEESKVTFTVTDIGRGILDTLYRKFKEILEDFFGTKKHDEILFGAFEKKYSSQSKEVNRNKGLPSIKLSFDEGKINNLKVLTNNVILHFDKNTPSRTLKSDNHKFRGTFYQWEMTTDCLKN